MSYDTHEAFAGVLQTILRLKRGNVQCTSVQKYSVVSKTRLNIGFYIQGIFLHTSSATVRIRHGIQLPASP